MPNADLIETFRNLEEDLWRNEPGVRNRVLGDDFREFCRFGPVYERDHLIEATADDVTVRFPFDDFRVEQLADNVVLVTYENTVTAGGVTARARRSSIWLDEGSGWRIHFQQATTVG